MLMTLVNGFRRRLAVGFRRVSSRWIFRREFLAFSRACTGGPSKRLAVRWEDRFPCMDDRTGTTGFDRHYVYHTAWAARCLAFSRPEVHVDIGSSVFFVGLVSAFVPVEFFDIRRLDLELDGVTCDEADLARLRFRDKSISSLSCMHVIEHVGLGRYGDALDPNGDLLAATELARVLAVGGELLVVVPVGRPRVVFNAHRVYSFEQVLSMFADLELMEFRLIPDDPIEGGLIVGASSADVARQEYGCGCFRFGRL